MSMAYDAYMKQIVVPMREELTNENFKELTDEAAVETFMENQSDTSFVVINSVCGCAAGLARPAAVEASKEDNAPTNLVTVFAGQDREATMKMREYLEGYEPSSPSMAILRGKEVIHFIPREEIEGFDVEEIVANIKTGFSKLADHQ